MEDDFDARCSVSGAGDQPSRHEINPSMGTRGRIVYGGLGRLRCRSQSA